MKLGEAIYKSQQSNTKTESSKDKTDTKNDNVVDADFEEVKDDKKDNNQKALKPTSNCLGDIDG